MLFRSSTVVVALKAGRYRLLAYSAINETPTDPVIVTVAVGETPEPPQPVDGLAQALNSIYGAIQEPGRAQTVAELAKIYRAFAANPQGKTLAEVFQKMKTAGQSIKGCQALREKIADHLDLALGVVPGMEIDSTLSAKIKSEFTRIAQILEGLK